MNIVFLDGYTTNPGDLSWEPFRQFGNFTVYDRTAPADVIERAKDAEILILNKPELTAHHLDQLPKLKFICVASAGYDTIDVEAARTRNIPVSNAAGYGNAAVAQMAVAHLLNVTNQVAHYAKINREGFWTKSKDFCNREHAQIELTDKKVCIVGYGNIGKRLADLLRPFGVKLFAVTSKPQNELQDVTAISLQEAFKTCDIVSLNCPLTSKNDQFINKELLSQSKRGLILLNTARGRLVNEQDIADALKDGQLGAYCCDVLSQEPPRADNPLLSAPNAHVTPHIAWATTEARQRIIDLLIDNIKSFLDGKPKRLVN